MHLTHFPNSKENRKAHAQDRQTPRREKLSSKMMKTGEERGNRNGRSEEENERKGELDKKSSDHHDEYDIISVTMRELYIQTLLPDSTLA